MPPEYERAARSECMMTEAAKLNYIFDTGILIAAGYQVSEQDRREYEVWFQEMVRDALRQGIAIPIPAR